MPDKHSEAWRIAPFDRVRSRIDPRQTGNVASVINRIVVVVWDATGWVENVHVDKLDRITNRWQRP